MIKKGCRSILRICNPGELISADAFEKLFQEHIGSLFAVEIVSSASLFGQILDCFPEGFEIDQENLLVERFFSKKIGVYDFFSPGFGAFQTAPFFLAKRNQGALKTRLLLIAHAPGAMLMEWALIAPLLKSGDLIIAPSSNAKAEILLIAPQLSPFVEVIPHPVHLLPNPFQSPTSTLSSIPENRFVSLSRIHPDKLIHRQIEAFAQLCQRGEFSNLKLDIAGPLTDSQGLELHYSRFLKALIKRLGLEDRVNLLGPVYGDQAKADLFSGARALLNLSVSLDESFGKSIVEGLGSGLPVICTDWNGFSETAGDTGLLVPVVFKGKGNPDLRSEDLAKVMDNVLVSPIAEADCRAQAKRSQPQKIASRYKQVLEQALFIIPVTGAVLSKDNMLELDFDRSGLLATLAPLQIFSYTEIFTFYLEHLYEDMKIVTGACEISDKPSPGAIIQGIMMSALGRPLSKFLAHQSAKVVTMSRNRDDKIKTQGDVQPGCGSRDDFFRRLTNVCKTRSSQRSQEISLLYCAFSDQLENFRVGLLEMLAQGYQSSGITYLSIELKLLEKQLPEAFTLALESLKHDPPTEFDFSRLRQLAKIARKMGAPEKALPKLDDWLEQFAETPNSGVVWLDLCANAAAAGQEFLPQAKRAFFKAYELLGDIPALQKLDGVVKNSDILQCYSFPALT
ncbi:MAG: glycosyltransferase family 4 protein [Deltaproteobacteria bacterium]|nr:glycosyltransferase family 4 protein [Deltaproteobacteria bacterium]